MGISRGVGWLLAPGKAKRQDSSSIRFQLSPGHPWRFFFLGCRDKTQPPQQPTALSSIMSSPKAKKRKIGSRSCDACKIRKVRCTEGSPCERCTAIGIECTFNKTQSTRGPRSLRAKTIQQIREAQQQTPSSGPSPSLPPLPAPPPAPAPQLPLPDPDIRDGRPT
jgi:hypothetical protein